jgi:prefoldin subunit 5
MSVLQEAEPLIFKREMKKATKIVDEKVSGYKSKISDLDKELAKLEKEKQN